MQCKFAIIPVAIIQGLMSFNHLDLKTKFPYLGYSTALHPYPSYLGKSAGWLLLRVAMERPPEGDVNQLPPRVIIPAFPVTSQVTEHALAVLEEKFPSRPGQPDCGNWKVSCAYPLAEITPLPFGV